MATISISIVVDYGVRIPDVADNINQRNQRLSGMTGLTVDAVKSYVQGVHLEAPKEACGSIIPFAVALTLYGRDHPISCPAWYFS